MIRFASGLTALLLAGCASTRPDALSVSSASQPSSAASSAALEPPPVAVEPTFEAAPEPRASSFPLTSFTGAPERSLDSAPPTFTPLANPPAAEGGLRHSRWTLKGGYYGSDIDNLDSGWIANVSWMRFFTPFLALELEGGYFSASGTSDPGVAGNSADTDLWGIPLMANARLNLPVWVLDLYLGAGIGTIYYDAEVSGGSQSVGADGFTFAGNGFLGLTLDLADSLALGIEAKYYLTETVEELDSNLDAYAVMLTVGWSR